MSTINAISIPAWLWPLFNSDAVDLQGGLLLVEEGDEKNMFLGKELKKTGVLELE